MSKQIMLEDFLEYTYLGMPQYNPSKNVLAFIASKANIDDNNYQSYLYVKKGDDILQLTSSAKEGSFYWQDDETIIFKNMRDKKDMDKVEALEELSVYYTININGGEATRAFDIPLTVGSIKPLLDNQLLLQVNYNELYSHAYTLDDEAKAELLKSKKDMQDFDVYTQVPFHFNGAGNINDQRSALFTYDVESKQLERITDKYVDAGNIKVNETSDKVYFAAALFEKVTPLQEHVYVYDVKTQSVSQVSSELMSVHDIILMNNKLIVAGSYNNDYGINENPKFYELSEVNNTYTLVADYDASIGSSVGSDVRYGGGASARVFNDEYYFTSTVDNHSEVRKLDANYTIETVLNVDGSVDSFDINEEGIIFVGLVDNHLQELYMSTPKLTQVSYFNDEIMSDKSVIDYEEMSFERDGYTLSGWVLKPKDYDPLKTYPAILDIHGGPKTVYGPIFYHEMQVWANMNAFVFFMNPRGSDGKGNEFADIRGKYGTGDYDDLMHFTNLVLETYPAIDHTKVAVTGGSYGGFMTNWIIGHTDRFVAAASQRSISNWVGFTYTSDIGPYFATDQQAANMFDDVDKLWWHSPLKYAKNVVTPTLFIHSHEDYRCPSFEAMQMYGALMENNVDTRLVMFKGENHDLSRSGRPKQRIKRLEEITEWLFKHFE